MGRQRSFLWSKTFFLSSIFFRKTQTCLQHANVVLPELLKTKVQLIGNTPGGHPLSVGKPTQKGCFGPNIITTGVIKLFEGITICYPSNTYKI